MQNPDSSMDLLFDNKAARKIFWEFFMYKTMIGKETNIFFLVICHAIILVTVQSFGAVLKEAESWNNFETETIKHLYGTKNKIFWNRQRALIPHESARRLWKLFSFPNIKIEEYCLFEFRKFLKIYNDLVMS